MNAIMNNDSDPAKVLRQFRVVFNTIRTHFQQIEKQVGLGGAAVWALSIVRDQPGIGVGGLALSMDIHQTTASNLAKTLRSKELISLTKGEQDRRSVQLHILPGGLALLGKVSGPFEGVLPEAIGQLPPATLARMDQDLAELIKLLKADDGAAGMR